MPKLIYTVEDLSARIADGLRQHFDSDQFLDDEIREVVQALVNSVRWSVLRKADASSVEGVATADVDYIVTDDHFASTWMSKDEIIARIEDTSGLPPPYATYCLEVIDRVVDTAVDGGEALQLPFLGELQSQEHGKYKIILTEGVRVHSPRVGSSLSAVEEGQPDKVATERDQSEMKTHAAGSGE